MKILITGINGFCGRQLAKFLVSKNMGEVIGIDINKSITSSVLNSINVILCDICNEEEIYTLIRNIKPDIIFHLSAKTFDPVSREKTMEFYMTNFGGTINLLEAIRAVEINPIILVPGSSAEYGLVPKEENPINEKCLFRPISPYGISKILQDMVGYQYFNNYNLKIIRTRAFNITGPGEREDFVCSNFARQIAMIEKGLQESIIKVGNLEAKRDFTDVRDIVRGYWLAVEKGIFGEVYNICSGKDYSTKEILDILLSFSQIKIEIEQDPNRMRPADIPVQIGDYSKFKNQTGWSPEIPLNRTLKDLLDFWRKKIKGGVNLWTGRVKRY